MPNDSKDCSEKKNDFTPREPVSLISLGTKDLMARVKKSPCLHGTASLGGKQT